MRLFMNIFLSAHLLLLLVPTNAFFSPRMSRRGAIGCAGAACLSPSPSFAKELKEYTDEEREALDLATRNAEGRLLPSGVRVISVTSTDGDAPTIGDRVYVHFKIWRKGFRSGVPADSSFMQQRPYDWFLGQPDARLIPGIDEGVRGMREGEWRRLVVPAELAYGDRGLTKGSRGAYAVYPGEAVYVDLLLLSTANCDLALRIPGGTKREPPRFAHDGTLKSVLCKRVGAPAAT